MKITNRTNTERAFCLPSGVFRIPPLATVKVPDAQEAEMQELLKTQTLADLISAKVLAVNSNAKVYSPTELPSPEPPESLRPKSKPVSPTANGKGGKVELKSMAKSGVMEV